MKLNQITITAEASKAYQKYCVALTAQDLQEGDIDILKQIAIKESLKGINELAANIDGKPEVKVTSTPVNSQNPYFQPNTPKPSKPKSEVLNIGGYNYKKCVNKQGGVFYALVNDADAQYAKKYLQVDDVQAYFNGGQYGN